mgnify:CR=1 FL=1
MSSQDLPFDVLDFLQRRIAGIDELEALLLVRSDAARRWTASDIATTLARPETWAAPALESLCTAELLVARDGEEDERRYAYQPTPALESVVTSLAQLYDERRADVLRVLTDNAVERIRAAAAKTFGGAFEGKTQARKRSGKSNGKKKNGGRSNGGDGGASLGRGR